MYGYRFVFQTMSSKYVGGANCTHCKPHSLEIIHRVKNKVIQGYNIKKIVVTVVANVSFFFFFSTVVFISLRHSFYTFIVWYIYVQLQMQAYMSLLTLSELKWINFCSSWNHQKTVGFMIISGGIEVN